jgi:HSP20 family protein
MNLKSLVPIGRHRTKPAERSSNPFTFLQREIDRLFENFSRDFSVLGSLELVPNMDVVETDKDIELTVELPGLEPKDVEVNLADDVLTIRGEKKFERKEDKENYHFVERSYGTFQRSLRIPWAVNPDEVQASFHNGVLTVTLPKSQAEEKSRRIAVRSGGGAGAGAQDRGTIQGGGGRGGESSGGGKGRGAGGP